MIFTQGTGLLTRRMMTVICNLSGNLYIISLLYLKLKFSLSLLEMVLWLLPRIVFLCQPPRLSYNNLCVDLPVTGPLSSAHGSVGVSRKLYSAPVARSVTFFYSVR